MAVSSNSKKQKKPATGSVTLKFRLPKESGKGSFKGNKPLADQASISHILYMMIVQLCRKIMWGPDIRIRLAVYSVGILLVSIGADFSSKSPTFDFFSKRNNFINSYMVKFGWGWTISCVFPMIWASSSIAGCGRKGQLSPGLSRLGIATGVWFFTVKGFTYIENLTGVCNALKFRLKSECLTSGFNWKGFDISGHCFLLLWNNLFILEEAKAYLGWEKIKDMIRKEEYRRISEEADSTPLSKLSTDEFLHLRKAYPQWTSVLRGSYVCLTLLLCLWDVMLFFTALYFHITAEKVVGSISAIAWWFLLYKFVYPSVGLSPGSTFPISYLPPSKKLKTFDSKKFNLERSTSWSETDKIPKFMGMPIYNYRGLKTPGPATSEPEPESLVHKPIRKRSRSVSKSRLTSSSLSSLNTKYSFK